MIKTAFEVTLLYARVLLSVFWAIYRLVFPKTKKPVARDIVLITGSGHGIGRELARKYGLLGARLVCVDINEENNAVTLKQLKELDIKAHGYTYDVSNRNSVQELATRVKKDVGFVTILINNAGIMPCKPFLDQTPEEITTMMGVNVFAHFWMLEAFLPAMLSNNYGHVVGISSMAGLAGSANLAPYCASKFAIRGLMEGIANEVREDGKNVKFTTVYPFIVDTGLCKNPKLGWPKLLPMQTPEVAAASIISAQRREISEVSIPCHLLVLSNILKLLPQEANNLIRDALKTGVEPGI